jgi:hypothetical protein
MAPVKTEVQIIYKRVLQDGNERTGIMWGSNREGNDVRHRIKRAAIYTRRFPAVEQPNRRNAH